MDCLVTGGAGFIGSHLVDALVAQGHRVAVLDNLSTGRRENLAHALRHGATLHAADVRDSAAVAAVFASARPEVVFHLAAEVDVRSSVEDPVGSATANIIGTIHVLEAARATGIRRLVNTSTGGGLYGEAELLPTPESASTRPLAPYGQSKLGAEGYCEVYTCLHGLSTISLRYGNVYGARQNPRGEAGVVAIFCGCMLDARRPRIFGDGLQTRDWVEVSDVVRANLLAAESDLGGAVNIASGAETSVRELISVLRELDPENRLGEPEFAPARSGEVTRSWLDVTRAKSELGWTPEIDLRTGLRRILELAEAC